VALAAFLRLGKVDGGQTVKRALKRFLASFLKSNQKKVDGGTHFEGAELGNRAQNSIG